MSKLNSREELNKLLKSDLFNLASKKGLTVKKTAKKGDIVDLLLSTQMNNKKNGSVKNRTKQKKYGSSNIKKALKKSAKSKQKAEKGLKKLKPSVKLNSKSKNTELKEEKNLKTKSQDSKKKTKNSKNIVKSKKISVKKGMSLLNKQERKNNILTKKSLNIKSKSKDESLISKLDKIRPIVEDKINFRDVGLPEYAETRLVMVVKDPFWAYVYWDINENDFNRKLRESGIKNLPRPVLRIYDITNIEFNGSNSNSFLDLEVYIPARSWYVRLPLSDKVYVSELGFKLENSKFISIMRSNSISVPPEHEYKDSKSNQFQRLFDMTNKYLRNGELSSGNNSLFSSGGTK